MQKTAEAVVATSKTFSTPVVVKPQPIISISLLAVGDILMHNNVIASGYIGRDMYDFRGFFSPVKDIVYGADIAIANLESPLAGRHVGFSGYPRFNTPDEIGDALKATGFDLLTTANNHIMDQGTKGAIRTLKLLQQKGIATVGGSLVESNQSYYIKDFKGLRIAFLNYTSSTNGIGVPKTKAYLVNMLAEQQILKDIKAAKQRADMVVILLHWGTEYAKKPSLEQRKLARTLLKGGVDIIIGGHPHVIQPLELIKIDGRNKLVAYSLGNFIGSQKGLERNSGVILKIQLTKDKNGVSIGKVETIPTFSEKYRSHGKTKFHVLPIRAFPAAGMPVLKKVYIDTLRNLKF